jgi:hypothetical protein
LHFTGGYCGFPDSGVVVDPSAEIVELLRDLRDSFREYVAIQKATAEEAARRSREFREESARAMADCGSRIANETETKTSSCSMAEQQTAQYEIDMRRWRDELEAWKLESATSSRRAVGVTAIFIGLVLACGIIGGILGSRIWPQ